MRNPADRIARKITLLATLPFLAALAGCEAGAAGGAAMTLGTAHRHAHLPEGSRIGVRPTEKMTAPAPGEDGS